MNVFSRYMNGKGLFQVYEGGGLFQIHEGGQGVLFQINKGPFYNLNAHTTLKFGIHDFENT